MSHTDEEHDIKWWRIGGMWTGALTTWAPGRLSEEGPFTNPARMCEDLGKKDAGGNLGDFLAKVWMHAGWWDR